MIDRIASGFHPFVLPFMFGMVFVLGYCVYGIIKILCQLPAEDRRRFFISLVTPKTFVKNIWDIFANCLLHVKLWKRNKLLGYMHSSIAFGWFMIILLGHLEVIFFIPDRIHLFYYPIFFNFFVAENEATVGGAVMFFLMDFFLLVILSGIALAIIKRVRSRLFGMRRTTRPSFLDTIGLYSLWAIFPLRLLAESLTADISGGSFLTLSHNWLFRQILIDHTDLMLPTWWAYSIALGIFMTVLPFTRYMHIPAEMMLIPMRNAGLCIRNARRGFARVEVFSCPNCGVCIDACPMSVRKANIKDATVYLNRQIRRNNEKRIEEISDKCLLCGKCTVVCQVGVEGNVIRVAQRATRKYAINQDFACVDVAPMKAQVSAEGASGNLSGASPAGAPGNLSGASPAGAPGVLYFAGCMTHLTPSIRKATLSVLDKAGVRYKLMDPDGGVCCGRPMLLAGRFDQAKELFRRNVEIIRASGCDTLLLSCPICYKMFRDNYGKGLEGIRVVHHSEYFAELVGEGRLRPQMSADTRYVFHDPCELGRGEGIYEQPREVIRSVGTLVEAAKNLQESICCGGSLGSLSLGFDKREPITRNSLANLCVENPDTIVTACPLCQSTFGRYSSVPVKDLSQVLDESLA